HLLAGMNDGVAGLRRRHRRGRRLMGRGTARQRTAVVMGMVLGVLGIMTRTMRHRHSRAGRINGSVRLKLREQSGAVMVNFSRTEPVRDLKRASCLKHLIGMAVDADMSPYFRDPAVPSDQNRGANDPQE